MNKSSIILSVIISLLLAKIAYDHVLAPPEPWIPVLEGTTFEYLDLPIMKALNSIKAADEAARSGVVQKTDRNLKIAKRSLLELRYYYRPMTEIRQLIYDADRLFRLGKNDRVIHNLKTARELLFKVAGAGNPRLQKPIDEVLIMLDELTMAVEFNPVQSNKRFSDLGHRLNLMLLKGTLILENAEFNRVDSNVLP